MSEYTATVRLDRQKRITIPKAIRDEENLQPGDIVEIVIRVKKEVGLEERRGNVDAIPAAV